MTLFNSHRYQRLKEKLEPTGESLDDHIPSPDRSKHSYGSILVLIAVMIFAATMTVSALTYDRSFDHNDNNNNNNNNNTSNEHLSPTTAKFESPYHPCGRNHTEATAAGCVFDVMMNSWLPTSCYDEELSADFWSLRDWAFFAEAEGTQRLSLEELSQRKQAHATLEYHFVHCIYTLRKVQRAIATGLDIEEDAASMHHDHHCSGILQSGVKAIESDDSLDEIRTTLNVAYPRCVSRAELFERKLDAGHH